MKISLIFLAIFTCGYFQIHRQRNSSIPIQIFNCSFDQITTCQNSRLINRTFLYILWSRAGFASELNQLVLAFAYSISTKRRFVIDSRHWNYGRIEDYFHLPLITNDLRLNRTYLQENAAENERIVHLKTTRFGSQLWRFWQATRHVQSMSIKRQVGHYLWKSISNQTFHFIQTHRIENLSIDFAIHIRRGDKFKEARAIPLEKYLMIIGRNRSSPKIFVVSDDSTVVEQLRRLKPRWKFVSLDEFYPRRRKILGHFQANFNRLSREQKRNETRFLMCELQILIDSPYVLCGMSSNICRLIQILRHQHPSTVISLDRSWHPR